MACRSTAWQLSVQRAPAGDDSGKLTDNYPKEWPHVSVAVQVPETGHPCQSSLATPGPASLPRARLPRFNFRLSVNQRDRISVNFDEHVTPFDLDWKTPHAGRGRSAKNRTSLDIEVGAMPGTFNGVSLQLAFTQRAAPVSAGVVNRVEGAFDVEEGDAAAFGLNNFTRSRRQLASLCNLYCLRHNKASLLSGMRSLRNACLRSSFRGFHRTSDSDKHRFRNLLSFAAQEAQGRMPEQMPHGEKVSR